MTQKIVFSKYQGAGNDFILIDNRNACFDANNHELIRRLCDRRFGIGADGLMLLQFTKNNGKNHDFEMIYYNPDGLEGTMCGNGGRCIVAFARDLGVMADKTVFLAVDGAHDASIYGDNVRLGMVDVDQVSRDGEAYVLNTGSPHYVQLVQNLADMDVYRKGYEIRNNDTYKEEGINVNFVEKEANGYFCRTFERGVEDETFACGTGATAVAMAMAMEEDREGDMAIPIRVLGGQLAVSFHKKGHSFTQVYLSGPAKFVFKGEITV